MELNKIYKGDCYELIKQIEDKSIDLVYTDIPYLIADGGASQNPLSIRAKRLRTIELEDIRHGIDYSILNEYVRVLKRINIFIWCNKNQVLDISNFFVKDKGCLMEILCWCKTNPTPLTNNVWLPNIEYCLYFREKGVELHGGYESKSKYYLSSINKKDKDDYGHPTIKPIEFVENHIINATNEKDVVLDTFIGSGTTAVACKHTNRQFIGFEINEEYYKIAVDRVNGIQKNGQMNLFETDFDKVEEEMKQGNLFDE